MLMQACAWLYNLTAAQPEPEPASYFGNDLNQYGVYHTALEL